MADANPTATVQEQVEIYVQHAPQVRRLATRLTGNPQDAEDLTQDVFERVFTSLDRYEAQNLAGWIHRITTNLFLDRARRAGRQPTSALTAAHEERLTDGGSLPADVVHDAGFDPDIEAALATLPSHLRVAVVLADVEQLAHAEIAVLLGIKIGTVRTRVHRGRAALRRELAHREPRSGRTRVLGALGV
ncbi:sigma-70 family RNA polymerase sigma factor [Aeromicrobium senzhongii]|uniref:Sigma-70 family RNA polymerase sigma factor n=1 Tax=Aeromicrobium senzhongii TaxID=2663859 RepID=A0ABX6SRW6_9ACTN|nr:sigma-70 family RNA polymerase sigma factor [Aeromicrobium senzhongii]MTB88932.1 sigma-70 family RNA polymerase sigma factor [Aeromicrobium senzhongii]QNL93786.1 sigma-70 family RNA polymerase sigma factor [Aeromicrobium senzhongii]